LPTPARATIETNADGEWHRREGEAAMTEPIEASEAWCKSRPEREAPRPDESTTQTGAAETSAHHRTTEASTYHSAANAATHHPAAKATTYHSAANAATHHPAAKATTHHPAANAATHHPAAKATTHRPAVKASTSAAEAPAPAPTHTGIRCRRYCHRARESDGRQRNYDLTHHGVPPFSSVNVFRSISSLLERGS
jgi:hypothetical protein